MSKQAPPAPTAGALLLSKLVGCPGSESLLCVEKMGKKQLFNESKDIALKRLSFT